MKKILNLLGTITLIGTSTTSLISCNPDIEKCNKETIGNFERICYREEKFNKVDNKWYIVIAKLNLKNNWEIFKFKNYEIKPNFKFKTSNPRVNIVYLLTSNSNDIEREYYTIGISNPDENLNDISPWNRGVSNFKAIYQYEGNDEPTVPKIDDNGNIII
ncbi:MAG: lipoprotein [Spiroplasma sp. hy2]|uniref:lipoprotein n=1 Tax=Spiroplasma sp. hy2 TaxID=2490850 RepID=UPI003841E2CF